IYAEMDYAHPQYNLRSLEGQKKIEALQGSSRLFFAGAHLGFGFHEDGLVSAKKAVALLSEKASL
nr:NAD/FAD-binding protein [Candidatus Moranbacteria bacterium]